MQTGSGPSACLAEVFAEGRLLTEEHSARVEHVYGAPTYAELAALIAPARTVLLVLPPVRSATRSGRAAGCCSRGRVQAGGPSAVGW